MKHQDLFHLGVVSADVRSTRGMWSSLFGYSWGPTVDSELTVGTPDGEVDASMSCAFTIESPRIEVISEVPGTLWTAGGGIHHLGYWSDDVDADVAAAAEVGFACEATRTGPDGSLFFAFCRNTDGVLVEFVTRAAADGLARCWSGPDVD
ncbi:VOC family protein [Gordonia sp. LSe1-13]|uniref:VOC family protein n=1 Tax=Gordonia sesuvii TaxID=3116777 RepID=A0ABU7M8N8_9ACTN|nr:VOC family protein [Gordonia sp. LSe1-13]